jgi:predicted nucleic acid-binding protein
MKFMSGKFFVDTNILIYAHDRLAGERHRKAQELLESLWVSGGGVLSTQVLQEFCVNLRRKVRRHIADDEIRDAVQDFLAWEIIINDGRSILRAMEIERRYQMSFWDALIIQAAEESGAEVLYSEDLNHQQRYGSVIVVNPFVQEPASES